MKGESVTLKRIDSDEMYPVYTLFDPKKSYFGPVVEIPDDKIAWIEQAMKEWEKAQEYLGELYSGTP